MKIKNSQQKIIIKIDKKIKHIALKISGGADSAILAYLLAIYKKNYRPDLNIHTITCVANEKAYQKIFSDKILSKITDLTNINWGNRFVTSVSCFNYVNEQKAFTNKLRSEKQFELLFYGENKIPPISVSDIYNPPTGRSGENMPIRSGDTVAPFKNIDKKGIKEIYDKFGVLDEIFPLTRSCGDITTDFSKHCQNCWPCKERYWGFGRYD